MGDMADWDIEQGIDSYFLHLSGLCGEIGDCQYCEEEYEKEEKERKEGGKE